MTWLRADQLQVGMQTTGGLKIVEKESRNGLHHVTFDGYSTGPRKQTISYFPDQEFEVNADVAPTGAQEGTADMAQRVNIIMTSDLSGDEGAETVTFSFEGTDYEIDLTEKESSALRKAVAKYVGAARVVKAKRKRGNSRNGDGPSARTIREWARENTDYEVPDRGRIPEDVREAYRAAHA